MGSLFLNTMAAALLISSLGYLIYHIGSVVKTFSSKWSPGCHDVGENEQCDHCAIAPKNRGIVESLQKTL